MKCKREGCDNESAGGMQVYCSKSCAPFGNFGHSRSTPARPTDGFSIRKDGDSSRRSSIYDRERSGEATQNGDASRSRPQKIAPPVSRADVNTRTEPESSEPTETPKPEGEKPVNSTTETKNSMQQRNESEDHEESPTEDSSTQRSLSNEVNSVSNSLLSSTIKHLHGLMKSVAIPDAKDMNVRTDAHKIMAACSCAKNIHSLMKLQLDVYREMRKNPPDERGPKTPPQTKLS